MFSHFLLFLQVGVTCAASVAAVCLSATVDTSRLPPSISDTLGQLSKKPLKGRQGQSGPTAEAHGRSLSHATAGATNGKDAAHAIPLKTTASIQSSTGSRAEVAVEVALSPEESLLWRSLDTATLQRKLERLPFVHVIALDGAEQYAAKVERLFLQHSCDVLLQVASSSPQRTTLLCSMLPTLRSVTVSYFFWHQQPLTRSVSPPLSSFHTSPADSLPLLSLRTDVPPGSQSEVLAALTANSRGDHLLVLAPRNARNCSCQAKDGGRLVEVKVCVTFSLPQLCTLFLSLLSSLSPSPTQHACSSDGIRSAR